MSKNWLAVVLIPLCIILPACSDRSITKSDSSISNSISDKIQLSERNILTTVLDVAPDDIESISYAGNAPYYFGGERGIWPKGGYSAILFSYPNPIDNAYADQEKALVAQFAQALGHFAVDGDFIEVMTENTSLPNDDYISMTLMLSESRGVVLIVFENGDIYRTPGVDEIAYHYKAADPKAYAQLKKEIEAIRASLDALPLDYQLSMGAYPEKFLPQSTAIRLQIDNIGAQPVTYPSNFMVEKWEDGIWHQLSKKTPETGELTIEPRSVGYVAVDLTNMESAQEVGRYRVSNTFFDGKEQLRLMTPYEISPDALDTSLPYKPAMTPENQKYFDQYLCAWGFYCPFQRDYNEETFAQDFRPYLLYFSSVVQEGKQEEYYDKFGVDVPADIVEETVMRHFPVTAEQFRASLPKSRNPMECYDPQNNVYHFEGGYGGVGFDGVITQAEKEEDILKLSCDWYDVTDCFKFSHTVTIRLGEGEEKFYYIENTVTTKQANAQ